MNIYDDKLNKWIKGQIYQRYRPQGFRFTIEYNGQYYTMENKIGSLLTDIRNTRRPNIILTKLNPIYFNPLIGSSKYNIQIFTNQLPDPIYIVALYALDSNTIKRRFKSIRSK